LPPSNRDGHGADSWAYVFICMAYGVTNLGQGKAKDGMTGGRQNVIPSDSHKIRILGHQDRYRLTTCLCTVKNNQGELTREQDGGIVHESRDHQLPRDLEMGTN
jgi:hypothetical protein